ncbi:hypothetical protein [Bradyrhizobium manausense]|nr:hypothetical protein [Bradyrhizobium manausense]
MAMKAAANAAGGQLKSGLHRERDYDAQNSRNTASIFFARKANEIG